MRKRRIKIRIVGGLGNQLFVYFAGLYLSKMSDRALIIDMRDTSRAHSSYDLRSFKEISDTQVTNDNIRRNQILSKVVDSYRYRFPEIASFSDNIMGNFLDEGFQANVKRSQTRKKTIKFSGYFQDFRYLANQEGITLSLDSSDYSHLEIKKNDTLAIHIRRGDFINEKVTHGCLDASWYYRAIDFQLQTEPEIKKIRIFSNDSKWVSSNQRLICPETKAEIEVIEFDVHQDPAISFLEFAQCKFRVSSNSTFSLLASYIAPGKTVVPFPYNRSGHFKALEDSSPSSWVRIPSIWED